MSPRFIHTNGDDKTCTLGTENNVIESIKPAGTNDSANNIGKGLETDIDAEKGAEKH